MLIWLLRLVSLAALAGFCAAVWYAGPMVGFGDARPLEPSPSAPRSSASAVGLVALYYGIRFWLARRAQMALEAAIADAEGEGGDASILKARMNDAIATLRRTSRKRNFLYELPWYLVIGPPGAGKTTALVNSGLRFPLAGSSEAQPVSGVGGTRFCDWWFTEDAVIIDTAGRYTTQDSDPDSDKKSWQAFLALLKRNRGRQPINGVILAISLADLMTLDPHSLGAHAIEVKNRLQELHDELKLDYPVYLLFTKADLVLGFMEYFGDFSEERRRKVWGATFQVADRKQNLIGEAPAEMDALGQRLTDEMADRLQEERDPLAQIAIFAFPTQFAALKPLVLDFLGRIFDPSRKQSVANLRGFYFSSGTQEGSPIDQVLGALGRNFGAADMQAQMSGTGKSFFLHDLLSKVIFAEFGLGVGQSRCGTARRSPSLCRDRRHPDCGARGERRLRAELLQQPPAGAGDRTSRRSISGDGGRFVDGQHRFQQRSGKRHRTAGGAESAAGRVRQSLRAGHRERGFRLQPASAPGIGRRDRLWRRPRAHVPHPFAAAARRDNPEQYRQSGRGVRPAEGLSHARRQGAKGGSEPGRGVVAQ